MTATTKLTPSWAPTPGTLVHLDASDCRIMVEEGSVNFTEAAVGDVAKDTAECEV